MTNFLNIKTWDWAFGQTPEFTYTLENSFSWGKLVSGPHLVLAQPFYPPLLLAENESALKARYHPLVHIRYRQLGRLGRYLGISWSP